MRAPHQHLVLLTACAAVCACLSTPRASLAQEERSPLRLSVISVASPEKAGRQPKLQLLKTLASSGQVDISPESQTLAWTAEFGVTEEMLRSGEERRLNRRLIGKAMRSRRLEALLIVDVFSRGRRMQLVVIGPNGNELVEIKRDISRSSITDKQAIDVLREALGVLVPEVTAYREAVRQGKADPDPDPDPVRPKDPNKDPNKTNPDPKKTDPDPKKNGNANGQSGDPKGNGEDNPDDQTDASLRDAAIRKYRERMGVLNRELRLSAGALVGRRAMTIKEGDGAEDYNLTHASPLVGVNVLMDVTMATFSQGHGALALRAFGSWAPFTTLFEDAEQPGQINEYSSSYVRYGAEIGFMRLLSPRLVFDVFVGGEGQRLKVDPNVFYTGNAYSMARVGLGFTFRFSALSDLRLGATAMPVFTADSSEGTFGEADFSLGMEGNARLKLALSNTVFLGFNYTFQYIAPAFPTPSLSAPTQAATTSTDMYHMGNLSLGVRY